MKIIKELAEMINDEVKGAACYAKKSVLLKDEYPELAKTFFTLANEELEHVKILHGAVAKMIEEYRAENGEPPEGMLAVYNYLHEKQIDNVQDVRGMLAEYKAA